MTLLLNKCSQCTVPCIVICLNIKLITICQQVIKKRDQDNNPALLWNQISGFSRPAGGKVQATPTSLRLSLAFVQLGQAPSDSFNHPSLLFSYTLTTVFQDYASNGLKCCWGLFLTFYWPSKTTSKPDRVLCGENDKILVMVILLKEFLWDSGGVCIWPYLFYSELEILIKFGGKCKHFPLGSIQCPDSNFTLNVVK